MPDRTPPHYIACEALKREALSFCLHSTATISWVLALALKSCPVCMPGKVGPFLKGIASLSVTRLSLVWHVLYVLQLEADMAFKSQLFLTIRNQFLPQEDCYILQISDKFLYESGKTHPGHTCIVHILLWWIGILGRYVLCMVHSGLAILRLWSSCPSGWRGCDCPAWLAVCSRGLGGHPTFLGHTGGAALGQGTPGPSIWENICMRKFAFKLQHGWGTNLERQGFLVSDPNSFEERDRCPTLAFKASHLSCLLQSKSDD